MRAAHESQGSSLSSTLVASETMTMPEFIGVDWGNTNARFLLIDDVGGVVAEKTGPGIAKLSGAEHIEATCFEAIGDWISAHPKLPVIMTGAVGSNIGWHIAHYLMTPATAAMAKMATTAFVARGVSFIILPGVETLWADGLPDVMRGEETQIFGALVGETTLACLPGTHAKWVEVENGVITGFHGAMTGELLDIIGRHSILLNPRRAPMAVVGRAFLEGVTVTQHNQAGLETLLFTVRSRQIKGTLTAVDADAYLAGLCIGAEVRSALVIHPTAKTVTLIGSPALMALYASALDAYGITPRQIDGKAAVIAGLVAAYRMHFK
jgi:2-dehydro-3-deoxygalactonokinase